MNHEILDGLYAARRELTRIIVATAAQTVPAEALQQLLQQRDHLVWAINRILVSDLTSSLADIMKACDAVDDSTKALRQLSATAEDVAKAITIASQILAAAAALV